MAVAVREEYACNDNERRKRLKHDGSSIDVRSGTKSIERPAIRRNSARIDNLLDLVDIGPDFSGSESEGNVSVTDLRAGSIKSPLRGT
jgi:hypothetical protein